jgi:hypothetical protein
MEMFGSETLDCIAEAKICEYIFIFNYLNVNLINYISWN